MFRCRLFILCFAVLLELEELSEPTTFHAFLYLVFPCMLIFTVSFFTAADHDAVVIFVFRFYIFLFARP